jgi:hypothetical protein
MAAEATAEEAVEMAAEVVEDAAEDHTAEERCSTTRFSWRPTN